ncbi:MAG: hypothetical protein ACOX8W_10205 [bacterium]
MIQIRRAAGKFLLWTLVIAACGFLGWFIAGREQKGPPERATAVSGILQAGGERLDGRTAAGIWEW